MSHEPYYIHNAAQERLRKLNNRTNHTRATSIKSRQELTPLSSILTIYTVDGQNMFKENVLLSAVCSDGEFVVSKELTSVNHQYFYKLLNALNALDFNIRFINTAASYGKKFKNADGKIVEIDLNYLKRLTFNNNPLCLKNNRQDSISIPIYSNYPCIEHPTYEYEKKHNYSFYEGIVLTLQRSIEILEYWYKKIISLQIRISDKFQSAITRSIHNANVKIEEIKNGSINLDALCECFSNSISNNHNTTI